METTPPPPPADPAAEERPALVFEWSRSTHSRWRLLFFIFVAFAGHAVFFYLFKVVTPSRSRRVPAELSVLHLRGGDAASANAVRAIAERSPARLLYSSPRQPDAAALRAAAPSYTPSYAGHQGALRASEMFPPEPLPSLAGALDPVLPKLDAPAAAKSSPRPPSEDAAGPQLVLDDRLAARGPLQPPVWPQLAPAEDDAAPFRFQIAIDSAGVTRHCFIESGAPPDALRKALLALRFRPAARAGLMWGAVEVLR